MARLHKAKERYEEKLKLIQKIETVITQVLDGMPESQACLQAGIGQTQFRRFINKDWAIERDINTNSIKNNEFYSWEEKFLYKLTGQEFYVLSDFNDAYKKALSYLDEREKDVINLRYKGNMHLDEIGEKYNLTKERVRQIESIAFRKLRYPVVLDLFRYGCDYVKENEKLKEIEIERDKLINDLRRKRFSVENEINDIVNHPENLNFDFQDSDISIDSLNFSIRTYNCLLKTGVHTLGDICNMSSNEVLNIKNLGKKSFFEIKNKLSEYGLSFCEN